MPHLNPAAVTTPNALQQALYERLRTDATVFAFLQDTLLDGLGYFELWAPAREWVNDRFWYLLGYDPGQVPADPAAAWRRLMHPDDLASARQLLADCLRDPARAFDQVERFVHRDGSTVWLRCQGRLLPDAAGAPAHLFVGLRDVTAARQQEVRSREVSNRYGLLLDNQSVFIIRTDPEGRYTYVNDLFCERFGMTSKIIGTASLDSIVLEDQPKCVAAVMKCFAEPEVPHQVVLRKPCADGTVKSNHWEFKGVLNEQRELVEILCVGYDVTLLVENLRKSQHLLEVTNQQNTRLQNFAYIVSHNIRSHSANLTSLVQLLGEAEDPDQKNMFLHMLRTSTDKLADTIVNLNDIVTVTSTLDKPREPRTLKAEIDKTLEALNALIREHGVTVDVGVAANVTVNVVPAYLDSILLNLIGNAIKYRDPARPAVIRLATRQEPGFVVLSVEDNGLGIDLRKNKTKLFGMYKTFHKNEDARGVGLFITKNQVEAMAGRIEAESVVGVGSVFSVYFNQTDELSTRAQGAVVSQKERHSPASSE